MIVKKQHLFIFLFICIIPLSSRSLLIPQLPLPGYEYLLKDPYQATLSSAISHFFVDSEKKYYNNKRKCLNLVPNRNKIPFLKNRHKPCFDLTYQNKRAPLVFILNGFGAESSSAIASFWSQRLHEQGYHVISIASPFFWKFNLGVISNALPGAIKYDSQDVYSYMKAALNEVSYLKISDISLIGYSLGGLQSLFIAQQDQKEKYFNFRKVIAVNPPTDSLNSSQKLDDYYLLYTSLSKEEKTFFNRKLFELYSNLTSAFDVNKEIMRIISSPPFSPQDAKGIIGRQFHESLTESFFITELVNKSGFFNPHRDHYSPQKGLSNARKWTFKRYFEEALWPHYSARYPNKSVEEFIQENSMFSLESFIKENSHVSIHHNVDDIILDIGDISFIKETFKDRAFIFPLGGHLGNVWYEDNINLLIKHLK